MRFDLSQAVPAFLIGLRDAILLVAAHEVDVDARLHVRLELFETVANPRNVGSVIGRVLPIGKQIQDEGRAAIAKGSFGRVDATCGSAQVSKLDLRAL